MFPRLIRVFCYIFFFTILLSIQLTPTQAGGIPAPVLKWVYGGCVSGPYCQTGWYASPAVADVDNDGHPEVLWGAYNL